MSHWRWAALAAALALKAKAKLMLAPFPVPKGTYTANEEIDGQNRIGHYLTVLTRILAAYDGDVARARRLEKKMESSSWLSR